MGGKEFVFVWVDARGILLHFLIDIYFCEWKDLWNICGVLFSIWKKASGW